MKVKNKTWICILPLKQSDFLHLPAMSSYVKLPGKCNWPLINRCYDEETIGIKYIVQLSS